MAEDVETRFDTYEMKRPLPKGKNENVIDLMKDELREKIMKKTLGLRAKTFSYLKNYGSEDKKTEGTKKCIIKRKVKFEDFKSCLETTQLENTINHLEKKNWDCFKNDHEDFIKNNKLIINIKVTRKIYK